nr:glycosyltransferase family 39 protein [Parvularcula mediterranea]
MTEKAKDQSDWALLRAAFRTSVPVRLQPLLSRPEFWILVAVFLTLLIFYDGIGRRDAEQYIRGARAWLDQGLYLGQDHWELRHPFVLPIAVSFKLFGLGNLQATLPNFLYTALLALLSYRAALPRFGQLTAFLFGLFAGTSALTAILAAEVRIFGPEIFFAALGVWLFTKASDGGEKPARLMAFSALACFLSWLCRESAAYLPMAIGLLSLVAVFWRKTLSFLSFAAFCLCYWALLAAEALSYFLLTGDPLYRYRTDLGHGGGGEGTGLMEIAKPPLEFLIKPLVGTLSAPSSAPFLVTVTGALIVFALRKRLPAALKSWPVAVLAFTSFVAVILNAFVFSLEDPYYYPFLQYTAMLVAAILLAKLRPHLTGGAFAAVVGAVVLIDWAGADFRKHGRYEDARFVAELSSPDRPVFTDPIPMIRARWHLGYTMDDEAEIEHQVRWVGLVEEEGRQCDVVLVSLETGLELYEAQTTLSEPNLRFLEYYEVKPRRLTHRVIHALPAWLPIPRYARKLAEPQPMMAFHVDRGSRYACPMKEALYFHGPNVWRSSP